MSKDPGNIYKKLLTKRGLERHQEIEEYAKKETDEFEKGIRKIKNEVKERLTKSKDKEKLPDEKEKKDKLAEQISVIEKGIKEEVSSEEIEKMIKESWQRLGRFTIERKIYQKGIAEIKKLMEKIKKRIKEEEKIGSEESIIESLREKYRECKEIIEEYSKIVEEELPQKNPESFLAHFLLKIKEYKKQLRSGIVETEYVETQKEKVKEVLATNRLVGLLGETGTGKTLLARKIAKELTGDYEFVPGHRFTSKEDLLYYFGIDVEKVSLEEIPNIIKKVKEEFREKHSDWTEKEIENAEKDIEEVIKGQLKTPQLITKILEAGVLKAAKEGKIVIIDEFNYIPPSVLGGINALVEARPGQKISIGGQEVEVKPGFGVILTGNITKAEIQGRYLGREKIDPALVNRLNSGLIEYGSLPQVQKAFGESILEEGEIEKGKKIPKRELFQVALSILADEKGNIKGPDNLLEKTWNLSSEFSLLQKLYAGEKLDIDVKLPGGQDVVLKEYAVSNRTFRAVLEQWKEDGYQHSVDYYIYDNLIRPASVISPSEAGQIFLLLKERGMFFQDKSWDILKVNPTTYRIEGIENIEKDKKGFKKTQELKKEIYYFLPQEAAEAFLGRKMPELKEIESVKKELFDKEKMEKYQEIKEGYEKINGFIANWEETINLYCQDEAKILGENQ